MAKAQGRTAFETYYKRLNKEQKKAVDAIEGPVMVIAGPGTGKTQVLTLRIANILLKTDVEPENILAITYTEAGVTAMRKRLAEIIGSRAYQVAISTFHSFANRIIQTYPESFPRIIGAKPMTDVDQIRITETLLDKTPGISILRPFGDRFHYLRDIVSAIKELKREGITPEHFADLVAQEQKSFDNRGDLYHEKGRFKGKMKGEHEKYQKQIAKNRELALLYARYQEALADQKLYDYEDMIMEALAAMTSDETLLRTLQEQYQYVLVDEHQDTNNAQNRIVEALMSYHDNPNLFMVGDEKQAIYRFQGASLENFHYFQHTFPGAQLISLKENYRSSQTILDSAASIMPQAASAQLTAQAGHPEKKIVVCDFTTSDAELYAIGQSITDKIAAGVTPEEIAVLYRTNRDAQPLARMLEKLGVPFHIESDLDILTDADIRRVIHIFTALNQFGQPEPLLPVLYLDIFGIDPLDVHRLSLAAAEQHANVYDLIASPAALGKINLAQPEKITAVYTRLKEWKNIVANRNLLELFDAVINQSGLLASVLGRSDASEALDKLNVLLDQIRRILESNPDATLSDFMDHLARMKEHRLFIRGTLSGRHPGKVRLMTAHRAKGLEFEYVYIINCHDTNWGNRYESGKLQLLPSVYTLRGVATTTVEDADERNLFYVALTRAKKEVVITYAKHSIDQREQLPSKFIAELKPELVSFADGSPYEAAFQKKRETLFALVTPSAANIADKDFIRELFMKRGLAVTHLNNYLRCPWEYFFVNLLRIPQVQDKTLLYGDAMHAALQDYFTKYSETKPPKKYLLERFQYHADRRPFVSEDRQEVVAKGQEALAGYYDKYADAWNRRMLPEFKIAGIQFTPEITLTGKIDRIEILNDTGAVAVTDYKTGRPKSRNEIEGKTRNADGAYKRQLVFYNLLLNNYKNAAYNMQEGVIDFIEPDFAGKYHREVFEIQPVEIKELEELIKQTAADIMNLSFWNNTCGKDDCRYCAMRQLMKV